MKTLMYKGSRLTASSVNKDDNPTLVFEMDKNGVHTLNKLNVGWEICKYNLKYVDFSGVPKSDIMDLHEFIDLNLMPDYPSVTFSINCHEIRDNKQI